MTQPRCQGRLEGGRVLLVDGGVGAVRRVTRRLAAEGASVTVTDPAHLAGPVAAQAALDLVVVTTDDAAVVARVARAVLGPLSRGRLPALVVLGLGGDARAALDVTRAVCAADGVVVRTVGDLGPDRPLWPDEQAAAVLMAACGLGAAA